MVIALTMPRCTHPMSQLSRSSNYRIRQTSRTSLAPNRVTDNPLRRLTWLDRNSKIKLDQHHVALRSATSRNCSDATRISLRLPTTVMGLRSKSKLKCKNASSSDNLECSFEIKTISDNQYTSGNGKNFVTSFY